MPDWIGWLATTVFAASYFCREPLRLRLTQGLAALLWLGYGIIIMAPPVIASNIIVAGLAIASALKPGGLPTAFNRKAREGGKER